jgi:uncharacterized protein
MQRFFILIFFALTLSVFGQTIPDAPTPPRLVNDLASIIPQGEAAALESKLVEFYNQTSTQITIVTTPDLGGTSVDDFAFKLGEKWGVGHDGRNNGIVMIVKPKTNDSRGEAFIATGYGLEGAVPDAAARRIVDNEMIPHFRENNYAAGIDAGVTVLMQLTRGEFTAEGYLESTDDGAAALGFAIIFIIVMTIIVISAVSSGKSNSSSIGHDVGMMTFLSILASSNRNNHGKWDNFSGGSGSFGGFGGGSGGFGGFGGGHFGGGGAGGSW